MKRILLVSLFLFPLCLSSQVLTPEFEFTLYMHDLEGRKDSVVIGFDTLATDDVGINTQFGEVNIATQPWKEFEMRIFVNFDSYPEQTPLTRKKILNYKCNDSSPNPNSKSATIMFLVNHANSPVYMTWDPMLFQEHCVDSSAIADSEMFFIYSMPDMPHKYMVQGYAFTPGFNTPDAYPIITNNTLDGNLDSLYMTFFAFQRRSEGGVNTQQQVLQSATQAFPNPAQGSFTIRLPDSYRSEGLRVIDVSGRVMYEDSRVANEILVSTENWARGIYFYQMQVEGGFRVQGKVAVY